MLGFLICMHLASSELVIPLYLEKVPAVELFIQEKLDDDEEFLVTEVIMGWPTQSLRACVSLDYSILIVPDKTLSSDNGFNSSESKTFNQLTNKTFQAIGSNVLTGVYASDTFKFRTWKVYDQKFFLANASQEDLKGLVHMGLGWADQSFESSSFVITYAHGLGFPAAFTVDLNEKKLTVGNNDPAPYLDLQPMKFVNPIHNTWSIAIRNVKYGDGNSSIATNISVIITLGSKVLAAPADKVQELYKKVAASNNCSGSVVKGLSCICLNDSLDGFKGIAFHGENGEIVLGPSRYVKAANGICKILIEPSVANNWVLGHSFLHDYAAIFNYDEKGITFFKFDFSVQVQPNVYLVLLGVAIIIFITVTVSWWTKRCIARREFEKDKMKNQKAI